MDRFSVFSLFLLLHPTFCFTGGSEVSVSAEEGVDSVLPCSGREGVRVRVLEWTRLDSDRDLLLYKAEKVMKGYEHPDYTSRVQLQHPQPHSRDLNVVLKKVTLKDSGKYQCYALYEDEQKTSQIIHLTVKGRDSEQSISAAEGQDCELPCSGLLGSEVSDLEWTRSDLDRRLLLLRGGKVLSGYEDSLYTDRVQLLDPQRRDLSVVLKEVTLKDGGTYRCQALYEDGQRIFKFIRLTVTERKQDTTLLGLSLGLPSGLGLIAATVIAVRYCIIQRWFTRLWRRSRPD